jgi:HEXXH motif-containing protein
VASDRPEEGLNFHRLPVEILDTLAVGACTPDITRYLWETERSRRLLLVVTLFNHCEAHPDRLGPLPLASDAWATLDKAREIDRVAVDDLLMHPQIGSAAAYALRRERGGAVSDLPVWVDLGLVHTLALMAAARVGLSWATRVPARHGTVMLPTLGMARFRGLEPAFAVEASVDAGSIHLFGGGSTVAVGAEPGPDTDSWWSLRHLHVDGASGPLTVWLDDLDPFRDMADPEPPARLPDATVDRWSRLLDGAWNILCTHHSDSAAALAEGVVSLVPMRAEPGWDTRSASNGEAFGSVMVSEPPDPVTLAVSLVHEFQHIKLGALMHLLPLVDDDDDSLYYAPWRDDPRPLGGFLQGIYAFFGIADFWRRHRSTVTDRDAALATYEYLYARGQTAEAVRSIRSAPRLTTTGRTLVDAMGSVLDTWRSDEVDGRVSRLARLTADSHRTAWRLRHWRPIGTDSAALARSWLAGRAPEASAPPVVEPTSGLRWAQRIPRLARRRAAGPVSERRADDPLAVADRALVDGDTAIAMATYLTKISQPSGRPDDTILAWVGLTLVLADNDSVAAPALLTRPDLVRAVHDEVTLASGMVADPIRIAAWLAPTVSTND